MGGSENGSVSCRFFGIGGRLCTPCNTNAVSLVGMAVPAVRPSAKFRARGGLGTDRPTSSRHFSRYVPHQTDPPSPIRLRRGLQECLSHTCGTGTPACSSCLAVTRQPGRLRYVPQVSRLPQTPRLVQCAQRTFRQQGLAGGSENGYTSRQFRETT